MSQPSLTAAILVIGNEILSGRTLDKNTQHIGAKLLERGIVVQEARIVADVEAEIVAAVNALRAKVDYVFTTGGIGPTHDDITADCIAAAFGKTIDVRDDARAISKYRTDGAAPEDIRRMVGL